MGFFDSIKNAIKSDVRQSINSSTRSAINGLERNAKNSIHHAMTSRSVSFTFQKIPTNVAEMQTLPECALDTPFKTAALTLAVLCNFANSPEETFAMLDFLKGPENVSGYEKQFITERLDGKFYKILSFFHGAYPENNYKPNMPYTTTVYDDEYSYNDENWATMYVQSSGADSQGIIKLRRKPSTGQWFVSDIQCLSDIRIPANQDAWA